VLSIRLKALASHYHNQESIWDIGCDHGQLGLSFRGHPSRPSIHLVDPSQEVILKLKASIDSDIPINHSIKIHHKKGQDLVLGSDTKQVFIAGMGGKEIRDILKAIRPQLSLGDRIVISPHRGILELREYLTHSDFRLNHEYTLKEDEQFYQIICLDFESISRVSAFGEGVFSGEIGRAYRQRLIDTFEIHQDTQSRALLNYLKNAIK
jgi:tRNA A22 N-methylase